MSRGLVSIGGHGGGEKVRGEGASAGGEWSRKILKNRGLGPETGLPHVGGLVTESRTCARTGGIAV